jgi:hypothetical protein
VSKSRAFVKRVDRLERHTILGGLHRDRIHQSRGYPPPQIHNLEENDDYTFDRRSHKLAPQLEYVED